MTAVCIVTPDFVGPVRNGGIGTHCYTLALTLAQAGQRVTVLFTGPMEIKSTAHWAKIYAARGIEFLGPESWRSADAAWGRSSLAESMQIYAYLGTRRFDVLHFQDWQAAGFHSIQARRTLGEFATSLITVTLHAPTEWQAEGMQLWPEAPVEAAALGYRERYCCEFADLVISPSQAMFDWCEAHGWRLAPRRLRLPCCIEPGATLQPAYTPEPGVVAFFGRLETRKGLELFVAALRRLADAPAPVLRKVLFVGKIGQVAGAPADRYLAGALAGLPFAVELHSGLDTFAARALLRRERALAVCPSLLDNLPFTIIECLTDGLPVIAARTGGIPELLPPDSVFTPEPRALAEALRAAATRPTPPGTPLYEPLAAAAGWRGLEPPPPVAALPAPPPPEPPLVSICVAHYNYGRFVRDTLGALRRQTHPALEIILVDDGSTDALSRQVLADIAPADFPNLTIVRQENAGPSAARNRAAELAKGAYLVFVDADNIPEPDMVEMLLRAVIHADLDIVTCALRHFESGDPASGTAQMLHTYMPLGPALELGALQNVFGDTNFLVRRDVFLAEGGFPTRAGSNAGGMEDWEFLARAVLHGRRLDVVPKFLLWYRTGHAQRSTTALRYAGLRQILAQYEAVLAPTHPWLFRSVLYPLYQGDVGQWQSPGAHATILRRLPLLSRTVLRLLLPVERALVRLLPPGSPIRRGLKRLLRRR
jgi:GT2 family glycosyltransferase